jgi:hypothetical protein
MKKEKIKVNAGGRGISGYIPAYDEQAYNYCLLGATNETLAEFFGVSSTTIKKWIKKYPGFRESIRQGTVVADMKVAESLYKRAIGYTYAQVVTEYVRITVTQKEPEKVTNTVGTFINKGTLKAFTTEKEPEKVTDTVGNFMNEGTLKAFTTQKEPKKVTDTVGTFMNEEAFEVSATQKEPEKVTN